MSVTRRPLPLAAFCLLLALFAARLGDTAVRKTLTVDEPHYIGTGLYLWRSGDYHYAATLKLHPPLAFHIASLPLLAFDLEGLPVERGFRRRLLQGETPGIRKLRIASRIPFILLACWGAVMCFLWAREVAGDWAGLLAAFLYTFSPLVLANGCLAHSDITVTVFFLQTLYTLWRWMIRPSTLRLVVFGISLGLAIIAKLSGIVLLASVGLAFVMIATRAWPSRKTLPWIGPDALRPRVLWIARMGFFVLAVALFVLWLGYGGSFRISEVEAGPWKGVAVPSYVQSLLFDRAANAAGRNLYLLGEIAQGGWWYYFPVAFAVKVPEAITLLLGLSLVAPGVRPSRLGWLIALPVATYLLVACFWLNITLGVRYLLPIFPLLFVFIATQLVPLEKGWRRNAVLVLCGWLLGASLWIHPHYLAYFNAAAGGPSRGHHYLLDSNIDWGQDLGTLANYLAERGNPPVWLAYFGSERPEDYGIRARRLPGCRPVQGLVAISANVREGLYLARNRLGTPEPGCYDWLKAYEPVAHPGYSIFVYEIPKR